MRLYSVLVSVSDWEYLVSFILLSFGILQRAVERTHLCFWKGFLKLINYSYSQRPINDDHLG